MMKNKQKEGYTVSKFYLKSRNHTIAEVEYLVEADAFVNIVKWGETTFAPLPLCLALENKSINPIKMLNEWYKDRGIPNYRDDLDSLLVRLDVHDTILCKVNSYALSLSDHYWLQPVEDNCTWEDVNFFDNDFDYLEFADAVFSSSHKISKSSQSPNYATDGMVKKAWIIDDKGNRLLLKGGYKKSVQEPFNELLASMICEELDIDHVNYDIMQIDNQVVCACPTFIDKDTELLSAYDIYKSEKKKNNVNDLTHYINLLEKQGILNARKQLENMIVLDYIMMNEDRHMRNFGVIRDVSTLEWKKVAPIYDTGQSLNSQSIDRLDFDHGYGKLFMNTHVEFDKLIKYVKNLSNYDFTGLDQVVDQWYEKVCDFDVLSEVTKSRMQKVYEGCKHRVDKIKEIQRIMERKRNLDERSF